MLREAGTKANSTTLWHNRDMPHTDDELRFKAEYLLSASLPNQLHAQM